MLLVVVSPARICSPVGAGRFVVNVSVFEAGLTPAVCMALMYRVYFLPCVNPVNVCDVAFPFVILAISVFVLS